MKCCAIREYIPFCRVRWYISLKTFLFPKTVDLPCFLFRASLSIPSLPGVCCPFLSCVYLALHSQNACACGCLCVCVCVCARTRARALRIVCKDKILRFKNTSIINIICIGMDADEYRPQSWPLWRIICNRSLRRVGTTGKKTKTSCTLFSKYEQQQQQ